MENFKIIHYAGLYWSKYLEYLKNLKTLCIKCKKELLIENVNYEPKCIFSK